jgi:uncharacterized protein
MDQPILNRRELLRTAGAAFVGIGVAGFPAIRVTAAAAERKKLLVFTRSAGFEHAPVKRDAEVAYVHEIDKQLQIVKKTGEKVKDAGLSFAEKILTDLGPKHGFEVTATKDGTVFSADNLARYDAFFFYTTGDLTGPASDGSPPMSAEGKKAFLEAIRGGKGFVGVHSATDTFHSPGDRLDPRPPAQLDPYIEMIGAEFIRHGAQQSSHMTVADPRFPGVGATGSGFDLREEWYALRSFQPDLHVILVQETRGMTGPDYQRPPYPATWARMHGQGRVFYTSMGHRGDVWTNPLFQDIMLGGLAWSLRQVDADATPNIGSVTPRANDIPGEAFAKPAPRGR